MAEVTVNGLGGPLATPAADDLIDTWDTSAGQLLKIRRDVFVGAALTGGGTIATGGFTLTVPASGTAALVGSANNFSVEQAINAGILHNSSAAANASGATVINVGTSATTIASFKSGYNVILTMVWGNDGASQFADLVFTYQFWGTTVISSRTVGAPAARTYTTPGGDVLQLAMAAGLSGVRTHVISNIRTN